MQRIWRKFVPSSCDRNFVGKFSIITVTALWLCVVDASACTNIIVGKKASVDGSVMVSYSSHWTLCHGKYVTKNY